MGSPQSATASDPTPVVFVVDDDDSVRIAIESLLRSVGLQVRSFASAQEFLDRSPSEAPACLVLDVRLPGTSGLELQAQLAAREPPLPIVFISAHANIPMTVRAIRAGALEFLAKPFRDWDLLRAIREALAASAAARRRLGELADVRARAARLTPREAQVRDLVVTGLMNKQIASELGISEVTVKIHRKQVMLKMRVDSVAELVRMTERARAGVPPWFPASG